MTENERKIAEAMRKSVDVRLPDDFADRLVRRIQERKDDKQDRGVLGRGLARVVLVAASVTLLLGFIPTVLDDADAKSTVPVVRCDTIRPADPNGMPSDFQLNGLAMFGFCREAIRRRVKLLVCRFCRRREDD